MSEGAYPDLGQKAANVKDAAVNNAAGAYNSIANHPMTQNITSGPAAQAVYDEKDKTANEFRNVMDSRKVPDHTTATGQPLTHYHSMFYNILSWQNPRVTSISYATIVTSIFFLRYVPVLRYVFKALYIVLGITAAAEVAGKVVLGNGLASRMRPRKYYTIGRESLDACLDDVEQIINFFVIEFQRVVFVENIYATIAAFTSALFAYLLVKFVPTWGLALIATSIVYLGPLIYIKNQKLIDEKLSEASTVINQQTTQFRDLAAQHTSRATEIAKSTASEYTAKAQDLIGQTKARTTGSAPATTTPTTSTTSATAPSVKKEDFPAAPSTEPFPSAPTHSYPHEVVQETTPIPDTAATIPENPDPEILRAEEVDGVKADVLAS
ncbi:hypothetical protein AAFC00_004378 [Neodothiora populina]|uniref:Reticulon-like protein n=1 Tax=Neodothiora populina TaxID=2781224 RepID=A0ABR3PJW0_9PEZI